MTDRFAELRDFSEAIAEKVETTDPVYENVRGLVAERVARGDVQLPRQPDAAARLLDLANNPDTSTQDIVKHVRMDPALAGRLLELANSAVFAGALPTFSLQAALVRLGLNRVSEVAFEMSGSKRSFAKDKRSNTLARLWKFSLATGFACEALAKHESAEGEGGFLTGIFHDVASPLVVEAIGALEREGSISAQSDARVLGLVDRLSHEYTLKILRGWKLPKDAMEAIRLQNGKAGDRRAHPMAHLLVCGQAIARELGMGVRPEPIDLGQCRDFHFANIDAAKIETARETVLERMNQICGN